MVHERDVEPIDAADGSAVRPLGRLPGAGIATFRANPNQVLEAIGHRTVDEAWYVVEGGDVVWIDGETSEPGPGSVFFVQHGSPFQVRARERGLRVLGVTTPPWTLDADEANREVMVVADRAWTPTRTD